MENEHSGSDMVMLGGMWRNTSKDGQQYLSGRLGLAKLLVFPNKNKVAGTSAPDYFAYVAPAPKKDTSNQEPY